MPGSTAIQLTGSQTAAERLLCGSTKCVAKKFKASLHFKVACTSIHTHTQTQIQKQQQNGCQCGLPPRRMRSLRWQTAPKAARRPSRTTSPSNSWNTSLVAFGSRRECRAPRSTTADGFKNQLAACSLSLSTEPGPHNWNFASSIWGKCTPPTTRAWCRLAAESTAPRTQKRRTATAVFDLCTDAPRTGMGNCVRE